MKTPEEFAAWLHETPYDVAELTAWIKERDEEVRREEMEAICVLIQKEHDAYDATLEVDERYALREIAGLIRSWEPCAPEERGTSPGRVD